MKQVINGYKQQLAELIHQMDETVIEDIILTIEKMAANNGKCYVIGNGGSAATASHMVNDLGTGLSRRNIRNFNVEALADNVSVCTALANDVGYDNIFYMQLRNKLSARDLLIAISCSGNSPNVVNAVKYAKSIQCQVIGMTGFNGGRLKELADLNFHVQTEIGEYGLVEDIHMMLNHVIYTYFIRQGN